MSTYLTTLKTEQTGKWGHTLLADLVYQDDELGQITVPVGFQTDFASIWVLHNAVLIVLYALVAGYGNYAATAHDWPYTNGQVSRRQADDLLYRALRAEGVAKWRAALFWIGVRVGGAKRYNQLRG
jgi:hypothetical protein